MVELSNQIREQVNEYRRSKWQQHLDSCSLGTKKLWNTIKDLSGKKVTPPNTALTFNGTQISDNKKCATQLCRQFVEHPNARDKANRSIIRKIKKLRSQATPTPYTTDDVEAAIRKAKPSKAVGPDGIAMVMLKNLPPTAIDYLTKIFNLIIQHMTIPSIWKDARIVPILKPGKPVEEGASYRPISLLCPAAKILEALLLPELSLHFTLADHQHGFRQHRSTTTALTEITTVISDNLNSKRPHLRTIVVALDLSKAFDMVDLGILLSDILNSTLPTHIKRFLSSYLNGRRAYVEFRNSKSKHRKLKMGVPQGGVLSPILFNLYMSKIPPPTGVTLTTYADDCTIVASGKTVEEATDKANAYLTIIKRFFSERKLMLATQKSSATLLTSWTREVNVTLDVNIDGQPIPTVKYPKILGVTLDSLFTYAKHANELCAKLGTRNRVLHALSGTTWGKEKETLVATYKAVGRSVINYAAPIWTTQLSDTQWNKIQIKQNNALRLATGCHLMTSPDHLHDETGMLYARQHNLLLTQQFVLLCHKPDHPLNRIITAPLPHRAIRQDCRRQIEPIADLIPNDWGDPNALKTALNILHQRIVSTSLSHMSNNRVLNCRPPPIDNSEKSLPRETRTTLAQLRSGWSVTLMSYNARINIGTSDACPVCQNSPHDTPHLFNCPSNPTNLTVIDLWSRPIEAAHFLQLVT